MNKHLSIQEKRRLYRYITERDGNKCLYCRNQFKNSREPIIEHLNDNRSDNRWDNLALSHQQCNIEKANQKNGEYLDIALEKLENNESHIFVGENFPEKEVKKEISTEMEISSKCYEITEQYLTDEILEKGWIPYKDLIHKIVYLARQKTGHGSEQSIRSHLKALITDQAPFEITKDKSGKKIIRRRIDKEG